MSNGGKPARWHHRMIDLETNDYRILLRVCYRRPGWSVGGRRYLQVLIWPTRHRAWTVFRWGRVGIG